jgi:20S proteasome alpha/beta subunit
MSPRTFLSSGWDQSVFEKNPFDRASTDCLCLRCESAALLIGESQSPSAQLLAQRSVFLLEVTDHILLVPICPAGKDQHEQLKLQ